MEDLSVDLGNADLPLNPKEQKVKNKIENLERRIKEIEGELREEEGLIRKEKRYEGQILDEINKIKLDNSIVNDFTLSINKWYIQCS